MKEDRWLVFSPLGYLFKDIIISFLFSFSHFNSVYILPHMSYCDPGWLNHIAVRQVSQTRPSQFEALFVYNPRLQNFNRYFITTCVLHTDMASSWCVDLFLHHPCPWQCDTGAGKCGEEWGWSRLPPCLCQFYPLKTHLWELFRWVEGCRSGLSRNTYQWHKIWR